MIALAGILKKYRARLRVRAVLVQEAFAVLGLAVGVALLFAAQIAGTSLDHSVTQLTRGLVGEMQLQLQARGPQGFPAQLLADVRQIPGVADAQPVVEEQANVLGPRRLSRLPVGSSATTSFGSTDSARAIVTRWRSPIDSRLRGLPSRSPSPRRSSRGTTIRSARRTSFVSHSLEAAFSTTVPPARRLKACAT
jgi:hypothetical protein